MVSQSQAIVAQSSREHNDTFTNGAQPAGVAVSPAAPLSHDLIWSCRPTSAEFSPSRPCGSARLSVVEVGMQSKASKAWTVGPSLLRLRHGHTVFQQSTSQTYAVYTVLLSSWAYQVSLTMFSWKSHSDDSRMHAFARPWRDVDGS